MTTNEIANAIVALMQKKEEENKTKREKEVRDKKGKYPFQVASVKRQKKVLGVDAKLSAVTLGDGNAPLEMHNGYSRFELTIVDAETKTTPTANIPASDIMYIMETTRVALAQLLTNKNSVSQEVVPVAYTQKLIGNQYKGLTPADVLLNDASQETNLLRTKEWLSANLSKYPGNKAQIDAITQAIELLHAGKLTRENVSQTGSNIEIYKTDYKFKTKKNEKGYNLVYGIEIYCDPTKNYPFCINIMNCYAPIETTSTGQKTIKMTVAENTVRNSMLLKKDEWVKLISRLDRTLTMFESANFKRLFEDSQIAGRFQ